jgi:hypothetical protein
MIGALKPNERLVRDGFASCRAPDGTPLSEVPQYIIVAGSEADPACVEPLRKNERLILAGTAQTDRANAEARFEALLAGREQPPRAGVLPIYIKERARNTNPKTGLSMAEERAVEPIVNELAEAFGHAMRELRATERRRKEKT